MSNAYSYNRTAAQQKTARTAQVTKMVDLLHDAFVEGVHDERLVSGGQQASVVESAEHNLNSAAKLCKLIATEQSPVRLDRLYRSLAGFLVNGLADKGSANEIERQQLPMS